MYIKTLKKYNSIVRFSKYIVMLIFFRREL